MASSWPIAKAVKSIAEQVETLAGHPGLVDESAGDTSAAGELVLQSSRLALVLDTIPASYLGSGRIEECLYHCFEECSEIKALLAKYLGMSDEPRGHTHRWKHPAGYISQRNKNLGLRAVQLASGTKLLAAHAAIDFTTTGDAGEVDLHSVRLNPACQV